MLFEAVPVHLLDRYGERDNRGSTTSSATAPSKRLWRWRGPTSRGFRPVATRVPRFQASGDIDAVAIKGAIPLEERAMRHSPRDPNIYNFYHTIGVVHLLQSHTDGAIIWFEKSRIAHPGFYFGHASLASAYGLTGDIERASAELKEAQNFAIDSRFSSIALLRAAGALGAGPGYWGVPKVAALFEATYFAGLRKAGMPEE